MGRLLRADEDRMEPSSSSLALWRDVGGAIACALLGFIAFAGDQRVPLLGWIDLAIHESGHVATYVFPDLVTAMMGSIAQVAVPLVIAACFLWRRELLSGMLCLAWAGTSARDASVYIGDAPHERLELVGGMHDWAFALGPEGFDALERAATVAGVVRIAGLVMVVVAVAGCLARPILLGRLEPSARAGQ